MVVAEIAVDVLGQGTSEKEFVEIVEAVLEEAGIRHEVGPLSTSIEVASLDDLCEALVQIHERLASEGAGRILTTLRIDDRRDKKETLQSLKEVAAGH